MNTKVSILIPSYKNLILTKICLRLIRKHTDPNLARVIVIDNDSADESLDYLRSLDWITLLERPAVAGESAVRQHSRALDMGLSAVDTPFALSIHNDTFVRHPDWLPFLLGKIESDAAIAGVGSWKLEYKPAYKKIAKKIEDKCRLFFYRCINKNSHRVSGTPANPFYLRSHLALYRTELLRKHGCGFSDGDQTAGKAMHQALKRRYEMLFLSSDELLPYVLHVNHATTVLNPEFGSRTGKRKGNKRVQKAMRLIGAEAVLADDSLDR